MTILAANKWNSNADLIADVVRLGYIHDAKDGRVPTILDATYGRGTWWKKLPLHHNYLTKHDLKLDGVDFRDLPHKDGEFEVVAYDPPYKLAGRATASVDGRYGIDEYMSVADRYELIRAGLAECIRVLRVGGVLLMKVQNQVCSGRIYWQVDDFTALAIAQGLRKIDQFHMLGSRPQPAGRRQLHARQNYSTLMVFKKAKS